MYNLLLIGDADSASPLLVPDTLLQYHVEHAECISTAMTSIQAHQPDLILLSASVLNSIEFIHLINQMSNSINIPIIYLTNDDNIDKRIDAFDAGADDCFSELFSPRESAARIKAQLDKKFRSSINNKIIYDIFCLDSDSFTLIIGNRPINITKTEFKLLEFFLSHAGKALNRKNILDSVWGGDIDIDERTIDAHIRRLRRLLSKHKCENYIQTVRSIGYRFSKPM